MSTDWSRKLRRAPRAAINMHVKIWRRVNGEERLVPGYCMNLSEDGIAVFMPGQMALDEKLELQFMLPGSTKEIKIEAVVRAINKFQYGMEFINPDSTVKGLLDTLGRG